MKNCSNCKHKLSLYTGLLDSDSKQNMEGYKFVRNSNSVCEDFYIKCANGHTDECVNWWLENGNKTMDTLNDMVCHESTDTSKILGDMLIEYGKMLEELKTIKK